MFLLSPATFPSVTRMRLWITTVHTLFFPWQAAYIAAGSPTQDRE